MTELEIVYEQLEKACCPEDVFGANEKLVPAIYRDFAKVIHPDHNQKEDKLAKLAFQVLNELKAAADIRIKSGSWGRKQPMDKCKLVKIGKYHVHQKPIVGDIADLYRVDSKDLLVKVARHSDDNDLLRAEAKALTKLTKLIESPVLDRIPVLEDQFKILDTWPRNANVLSGFSGFITLEEVKAKVGWPPPQTAVWMFKRLLTLLGWVHHAGLIHGAILPPHVMVFPDNASEEKRDFRKHSIRLIDWCYSVEFGQRTRLSSWIPRWESLYAPELLSKKSISPTADIYMAAATIQYLTSARPAPLQAVLDRSMEADPTKRFQTTAAAYDAWKQAAATVYGKPKWIEFNVPK